MSVDGIQQGAAQFTNNSTAWVQFSQQFTVAATGPHDIQFYGFNPVIIGDMVSIDLVTIAPS